MKYTATQIKHWDADCSTDGNAYKPARSIDYTVESWSSRIKNALGVLTGRYDALDWEEAK